MAALPVARIQAQNTYQESLSRLFSCARCNAESTFAGRLAHALGKSTYGEYLVRMIAEA